MPANPRRPARLAWAVLGLVCVGLGGIGTVLPGLPTTIFLIAAAACFSRSSPRLERWVLDLPVVGRAVRDHRDGLGMPRRAKTMATLTIAGVGTISATLLLDATAARLAVAAACTIGIAVVLWHVPTRERVLARRSASDEEQTEGAGADPIDGPST